MNRFIFENFSFDQQTQTAHFSYSFEDGRSFQETYVFTGTNGEYNHAVLEKALRLAHFLIGTSYFKTFPSRGVVVRHGTLDEWQASFLNGVYQEGLSQYAYENGLHRNDLAHFEATGEVEGAVPTYAGDGIVSLQSGGKDSLLTASFLNERRIKFASLYLSNGPSYPAFIEGVGDELIVIKRFIDKEALKRAAAEGAKNGHVPITYIVMAIALVQAVLTGKNTVLTSVGHEGEELHATVGDLSVSHQWSKTWHAEQQFGEYVRRYISPELRIGSPLRRYSELRIAELFAKKAWKSYGHDFSSCNRINYTQGNDNTTLRWCGECSKCANSYLLFVPFVDPAELKSLFNGQDLFEKPLLEQTFKGLLGVDNVQKPFECIGEIEELRLAYHMRRSGYGSLPFGVPPSSYDYMHEYPAQAWTGDLVTN